MKALRVFLWATVLVTVYIVGRYNLGHLLPNSSCLLYTSRCV